MRRWLRSLETISILVLLLPWLLAITAVAPSPVADVGRGSASTTAHFVVAADAGADGAATVGGDAAASCLNSFTADTPVTRSNSS